MKRRTLQRLRAEVRPEPELYAHLNPMPFEAAAQMERDLAEDLRQGGTPWLEDTESGRAGDLGKPQVEV